MHRPRPRIGSFPGMLALASALAVLIASLAAAPAVARDHHRHHAHHARPPLRGIDVSHFQGKIDWPAVAHDHVSFAYIKATEGLENRDSRFDRNWRGAERAGLRVGAYHYFVFCRSGEAQAHNFLAVAPRQASGLPPAVDLEMPRGCHGRLRGAQMRRELTAYLRVVEARERRRAVLYVTPQFYRTYRAYLPERALWRRSIRCKPAGGAKWALWQYRMRGRVAGIHSFVDMNLASGGRAR